MQTDDEREIANYLLGELSDLDRARFERRMQGDSALRAEVDRARMLHHRLERLPREAWDHATAKPTAPPEPQPDSPARVKRRGLRSSIRGGYALAGAFALLLVLVLAVLAIGSGSSSSAGRKVELVPLSSALARSRATATVTDDQRLQMSVEHLRPTDPSHYYELWLMTDTKHLIPVASFRVTPNGSARLALTLPAPATSYRYLNISLQRVGAGSTISSDSLLRGATASA
jgi:anti-sigma-K factor RskA